MSTLQTIEQALFAVGFAIGAVGLICNYFLFNTLQRKHPKYYEQIGRPTAFGRAYIPEPGDYSRSLRGAVFVYSMVFKGVPADFPKDSDLQKQAHVVRYIFSAFVITFVVVAILFYPAFK